MELPRDLEVTANGRITHRAANCCAALSNANAVICVCVLYIVPPHFTELPRDLEVTANGRIALQCVAEGTPTPTIAWKINNTDFHGNSTEFASVTD